MWVWLTAVGVLCVFAGWFMCVLLTMSTIQGLEEYQRVLLDAIAEDAETIKVLQGRIQ